jgi:hypothetical protein
MFKEWLKNMFDSWFPEFVALVSSKMPDKPGDPIPTTKTNISKFQYDYPYESADGRFLPVSWTGFSAPNQHALTQEDIQSLADEYDIPVAHLAAVVDVEAAGSGFLLSEPAPARPKILFEGHKFYKNSGSVPVSKTRPDLSHRRWTTEHYRGGSSEWDRMRAAMEFHEEGALMSASYGMGQVLGENYKLAGCDSVQQYVVETFMGERQQLQHMINFIVNTNLITPLRKGQWSKFARGYNGPAYRKHGYHTRLAAAARKY